MDLFQEFQRLGGEPDDRLVDVAVTACIRAQQYKRALQVSCSAALSFPHTPAFAVPDVLPSGEGLRVFTPIFDNLSLINDSTAVKEGGPAVIHLRTDRQRSRDRGLNSCSLCSL